MPDNDPTGLDWLIDPREETQNDYEDSHEVRYCAVCKTDTLHYGYSFVQQDDYGQQLCFVTNCCDCGATGEAECEDL